MKIVTFAVWSNVAKSERAGESYNACIHKSASWTWCSCMSPFFSSSLFFYRFSSCRSFAPSYISLIPIHFSGVGSSPQRKQKNTSHLAHTKKNESLCMRSFVSKATSCYIFHAMYTSLLCACSYVVLSIFSSLLLPLPNPSQTNFILPLASHSRYVDHKKAVFTFNIFFTPPVFMCVSPMMVEKTFFATSLFKLAKLRMNMVWEAVLSMRMLKKIFSIADAVMGIFPTLTEWEEKKEMEVYVYMFESEYEIGFVLCYCCSWNANIKKVAAELFPQYTAQREKKC